MRTLLHCFFAALMTQMVFASDQAQATEPVSETTTFEFNKVREREWFLFVAEGLAKEKRLAIGDELLEVVKRAEPKSAFHVFSCPSHEPVATVTVPEGEDSLRLRSPAVLKELKKIVAFLSEDRENGSLQLELPRVGASVYSVRRTQYPAFIVCCGDPIYDGQPHYVGFSMVPGVVPTLITTRKSPLSHLSPFYEGTKAFPQNAWVIILSHTAEYGVDSSHREAVENLWRAMIAQKDSHARLVRITASVKSAFDLNRPQILKPIVGSFDTEFGMRQATMRSSQLPDPDPDKSPKIVFLGHSNKKPPTFKTNPPTPQSIREVYDKVFASDKYTGFFLRYLHDASDNTLTDGDLRIRHPGLATEMSYLIPNTIFAKQINDVRYGGSLLPGVKPTDEVVENWEVAIVKNEYLSQIEVWVNTFVGVGPIDAEMYQVGGGKSIKIAFTVESQLGDFGDNSINREHHEAWHKVELPSGATVVKEDEQPSHSAVHHTSDVKQVAPTIATSLVTNLIQQPQKIEGVVKSVKKRKRDIHSKLSTFRHHLKSARSRPNIAADSQAQHSAPVISPQAPVAPPSSQVSRSVVVSNSIGVPDSVPVATPTILPAEHIPWEWNYLCCPAGGF